jgi:hypothetical protein
MKAPVTRTRSAPRLGMWRIDLAGILTFQSTGRCRLGVADERCSASIGAVWIARGSPSTLKLAVLKVFAHVHGSSSAICRSSNATSARIRARRRRLRQRESLPLRSWWSETEQSWVSDQTRLRRHFERLTPVVKFANGSPGPGPRDPSRVNRSRPQGSLLGMYLSSG